MDDRLNQHLRQALEKPSLDRVTIEIEETFAGSNDNFIEVSKELLISLEYAEGMLIVEYFKELLTAGKTCIHARCVEIISKERVKRVAFDEAMIPSRIPLHLNQSIPEL